MIKVYYLFKWSNFWLFNLSRNDSFCHAWFAQKWKLKNKSLFRWFLIDYGCLHIWKVFSQYPDNQIHSASNGVLIL